MIQYFKNKILNSPNDYIFFNEYMADSLYHPEFGYYMKNQQKIGKKGDFYTSSSVHPVFAEVIAKASVEIFTKNGTRPLRFCEMGGGTGRFAQQYLDFIKSSFPEYYAEVQYLLIEKSDYHREWQRKALEKHGDKVMWVEELAQLRGYRGIFFSNELVDSFPVHVVKKTSDGLLELAVTWDEEREQLQEVYVPVSNEEIVVYLREQQLDLAEGQQLEIPLDAVRWAAHVAEVIEEGIWLTVDYGYTHEELLYPQYRHGTLLTYFQHQVNDKLLELPGMKDITYHIHFDALIREAALRGWQVLAFDKQNDFLLKAGILEFLQEHQGGDPFRNEAIKRNRAIQYLISGEGISHSFRILVVAKGSYSSKVYSFMQPFSYQKL